MPTVITTSTASAATAYSNQRKVDRCQNGVLWVCFWNGTATTTASIEFWYSTDNGTTWTHGASDFGFASSSALYIPNLSFFIDLDDFAHVVYKDRSDGYIYYRRGTPNVARTAWTWSAAHAVTFGPDDDYPDVVAHREGAGWVAHIVSSFPDNSIQTVHYRKVNISSTGTITLSAQEYIGSSYGTTSHRYPSIDFNHTGDGKTIAGGTPHLYAAWSAATAGAGGGIRFRKATYSAGSWAWGTERGIDGARYVNGVAYWLNCMFDGTRVVLAGNLWESNNTADVMLYERDAADTTTTTRILIADAAGTAGAFYGSMSFDNNGNVYIVGRQAGLAVVQWYKWSRASTTLEPAVIVDSATGSTPYLSAKRGYSSSRIEWVWTDGPASPYNVTYEGITLNQAPYAPTLVYPVGNNTIDRTIAQRFDWDFSDPDAGDTQSQYQIQYRVAGTATWTVDAIVTSTNTYHDYAANHFAAGDYEWQARTADSLGVWGPWSASSFFTAATPPSPPSITDPTAGQTIPTASYTVRWSAPSQEAYQVRTVADSAGAPNATIIYHDTGEQVSSSARSRTVPFETNNRTEHVQVRVRSAGLWSAWASILITVRYNLPPVPDLTMTSDSVGAFIRVVVDNNNSEATNLLTENQRSLETDTTGWNAFGNSTIARSTTYAVDGVASLAVTSNAAGTMSASTGPQRSNVQGGLTYTARAAVRTSVVRDARLDITWRDSAGAFAGQSGGTQVAASTTGWTVITVTATAPANAVTAFLIAYMFNAAAGGEVMYVDAIALREGTRTEFIIPSATHNDLYRRIQGATAWERIAAGLAPNPSYFDYEVASDVTYEYKVTAKADSGASSDSSVGSGSITLTEWWLKDPAAPADNMTLFVDGSTSLDIARTRDQASYNPLSRPDPVVVSDVWRLAQFSVKVQFTNNTQRLAFEKLFAKGKTLLLQAPMPGRQWYFRFGKELTETVVNTNDPYEIYTFSVIEVAEPAKP